MRPVHAAFAAAALAAVSAGSLRAWLAPAPAPLAPASGNWDGEPARVELFRPRENLVLTRAVTRSGAQPWMLERPADLADAAAAEELLAGLRRLEYGPPLGLPPAAAGLGPADAAHVRVFDAAGRLRFDARFGRRVFTRSAYVLAREGDAPRVASGLDPALLTRQASDWREARLLPGGCEGGLELSAGNGPWRRAPEDAARELCSLRAARPADETLAGLAGFDRPLLRARLPDGRGFTVGDRRGAERLVRVEGREAVLRVRAVPVEAAAADLLGSGHDR